MDTVRLRLVAGEWGGRRLVYPRGVHIRPTAEAVREALFSSLAAEIPGARFADLFAGTGAVGLEALSRGAERAVFLEEDPRCVEAIRANMANLRTGERAVIIPGAVETQWQLAAEHHGPFDLVFADPPYAYANWEQLLHVLLQERQGLADAATVIVEHTVRQSLPAHCPPTKSKRFGETGLAFFTRRST